jgi:NADPH2:quinone reductase
MKRGMQMKAIRVHQTGGPEAMQLDEIAVPTPGTGETLIEVAASGLNYIDVYFRTGLYPAPLPFTLGMEGAGTVRAIGSGVAEVAVGDRVAWVGVPGAYAEMALVPAVRLVKLPATLTFRDGAAAMLQGMTAHYLAFSTYALKPGDACLVHAAAGGVGLLLCQVAKRCGATVIATVSTEAKAELARGAGADHVILYSQEDFVAGVRRATGGAGVHVVYDGVGVTTFMKGLDCLRPRGLMALFGQASGPVPPFDLAILNGKGSLYVTRPTLFHYIQDRAELLQRATDVLGWVASGELRLRIEQEFPLANAADAHRALEGRKTTGKVLLVP